MFTCAKIRNGSTYLSTHLSANDYYAHGEQVAGVWLGRGADLLGIEGHPIGKEDSAFEALRLNQNPDGSGQLTPRNPQNSIRFYDFQCSAQKSVSILAVTLGDDRLGQAHDRAARCALAELEKFAAIQVRQQGRKCRETTGNLCVAAFRHDASRELDPQLHTHFVVVNATYDPGSRRWLALETHDMFKAIRYAGKCYQNELALQCRRLGYAIEPVRMSKGMIKGFEINGVSEEIRLRYSKRREEVEAAISRFVSERGREPSAAEIAALTKETRSFKLKEITTHEVLARQRTQLSRQELLPLEEVRNHALSQESVETPMHSPEKALAAARDHLFERRSVLTGHEILAEALNQSLGTLDRSRLTTTLKNSQSGLVPLGTPPHEPLNQGYATREGLALERWAVEFVNRTKGLDQPLGPTEGIPFQFQSEEQRQVVQKILACRDRVCALEGVAGAGKTTSLREIHRALEASGPNVYYLAPTSSAAKVLKNDGFSNAITLADFFTHRIKTQAEKLRHSVLIVDEAGLQSNKLGAAVLKVAERYGSRVLFVGDTRQHVSVEAGDFLRMLKSHSHLEVAELTDIRRQTVAEYKQAVREMAAGHTLDGVERIERLGWVKEARAGYLELAAKAFLQETGEGRRLDRVIAICPTWAENHRFTNAIRTHLKAAGSLSQGHEIQVHESLDWTRQQRRVAANYRSGMIVTFNMGTTAGKSLVVDRVEQGKLYFHGQEKPFTPWRHAGKISVSEARTIEVSVGDRILIRRNHRPSGVVNGDVLTVSRIDANLAIHTKEGPILPADFRDFCHGYVVTSHKAQGRTHQSVILAAAEVDAKAAYVACSRGREHCHVFTPDLEHFLSRLPRSGDRTAALDVTAQPAEHTRSITVSPFRNWWDVVRRNGLMFLSRLREGMTSPSKILEPVLNRRSINLDSGLEL